MVDVFSKKKRSEIMSKIRSKNTGIEKEIFLELKKRKIHFQKHYKKVVGNPDIALPQKRKAIFIDGDFWHGYKFKQQKKRLPLKYWANKIEENINRDRRNRTKLKRNGWKVLRVWGHEIKENKNGAVKKMIKFLS
jgi:DNA mismatch endonuclease (patch repair protein)